MKQHQFLYAIVLILLWSTSIHAAGELGEGNGINDNPHNLSSRNNLPGNNQKAVSETQICIFCHTPHGATPDSPLWGRLDPIGQGGFLTLTNPALGISDPLVIADSHYDSASGDYPNGSSKLCLSCHDGVTAMGILADGTEIDMDLGGTGKALKVVDLTKSHPISFAYNATVVTTLVNDLGKSLQLPVDTATYLETDKLGQTWVQCTSCHQPHQNTRPINTYPFWRNATANPLVAYNTVCDACHVANPTARTEHNYP